MSEKEDPKIKVEQRVTSTVGAEIYKDFKWILKLCCKGIVVIIVLLVAYSYYTDTVREHRNAQYQQELEEQAQQRELKVKQQQQIELAKKIKIPIAWDSSDKWRRGIRSWGNSGFIFTSNQFILNIDSSKLTKEQKARIQGKEFSCVMKLSVGDYQEYIVGDSVFGLDGNYDTIVYSMKHKGKVTDSMLLYVDLDIEDADKKAPNFDTWDLKCGDLVSFVEYN